MRRIMILLLNIINNFKIGIYRDTNPIFATSKETGAKENLGSKDTRDLQVRLGLYKDPEDVKSDSKAGDIAKNIAYLLKSQGKTRGSP